MKFFWTFLFFLLVACGEVSDSDRRPTVKYPLIEIQLHEDIKNLVSASSVPFSKECMRQVNMCWYKVDNVFGVDDLPSVLVDKSLQLDQITSLTIAIDQDLGCGIENLSLAVRGLPDNTGHEENQAFLYAMVRKIKTAGWVHYYAPSDPRISGSQSDKVELPEKVSGDYVLSHPWLDPDFKVDIKRWLKIDDFYDWHFHKNANYLTLRAWRRDSDDAPNKLGSYLVTLDFFSEREYWRAEFQEAEDKLQWKKLLPDRLENYKKVRFGREKKAIEAGLEVDSSYQDPPIGVLE